MTSMGRGRGRGWGLNKDLEPIRPGIPPSLNKIDCSGIIKEINLTTNDTSPTERIKMMEKFFSDPANKEDLKGIMDTLYNHALDDTVFGKKFIMAANDYLCKRASCDCGRDLLKYFVSALQTGYTRREELREDNMVQFRNSVSLLAENYRYLKMNNVRWIKVFELPLMEYMEMLLETSAPEDIRMFAELIGLHGKCFKAMYRAEFTKLMICSREVLIKKDLSPGSRRILLYLLDLVNHNFSALPSDLQKFYELHFDISTEHDDSNDDSMESFLSVVELVKNFVEILATEDASLNETNEQKGYTSNNRTLRAIRGSGATNATKEYGRVENRSHNESSLPNVSSGDEE